MLNQRETIAAINAIHFMPGWNVVAEPNFPLPWERGGDIRVTCHVDTVNSNHDQALKGYPEHITIAPRTYANGGDFDTVEQVQGAIFTWLMELFTHEAREFFRVGPDMVAPYHPHRPEGEQAFARLTSGALMDV